MPETIRLSTSLIEPADGREMPEEETSETPQNSPISLLEVSEEEARDDTTFFFIDLEEVPRDDAVLKDAREEDELAGLLPTAEEDSWADGALLTGVEELCCPGVLPGTEPVSPGFV